MQHLLFSMHKIDKTGIVLLYFELTWPNDSSFKVYSLNSVDIGNPVCQWLNASKNSINFCVIFLTEIFKTRPFPVRRARYAIIFLCIIR